MLLSPGDGSAGGGLRGRVRALGAAARSTVAMPRGFRAWRRERPFVGGLLTILAGVELLLSGPIDLEHLSVAFGVQGAQATLLPLVLMVVGVLAVLQPVQHVFYGVVALLISVYTLVGVNLGGFFVGFLLGVAGGVTIVSWLAPKVGHDAAAGPAAGDAAPAEAPAAEAADESASADQASAAEAANQPGPVPAVTPEPEAAEAPSGSRAGIPLPPAPPAVDAVDAGRRRAAGERSAAVVLAGVLATGGLSAAPLPAGADCWDPVPWLPIVTCPTPSPTPTPSPSASPSGDGNPVDDVVDGVGDAAGGVVDGVGDAVDGDGDPPGEPVEGEPVEGPDGAVAAAQEDGEIQPEEAEAIVAEAVELELGKCVELVLGGEFDVNLQLPGDCGSPADGNLFSLPGDLESRDLHPLTGLTGIGLVNVPVTGGDPNGNGRRDVIRLSASELTVDGFWLKTYAYDDRPGHSGTVAGTETNAGSVELRGNVQMYVSSIHANLPDGSDLVEVATRVADGASLVEILLGLVDARMGLVGATSDVQVWNGFREQVWSS